jgi:hypothetical protein
VAGRSEDSQDAAAGGETFTVRYAPRKVVVALAKLVVVVCLLLGIWLVELAQWQGPEKAVGIVVLAVLSCLFLWPVGANVWVLTRWALPGRSLIDLDGSGAWLNAVGLMVPWSEVSEITLFPARAGLGRARAPEILGLACADPEAVLGATRLSWLRRRALRRAARACGTPFTICGTLTDQTAEQIASAASGLAGLPVRRF